MNVLHKTIETELSEVTAKAIELAGSKERFQDVLNSVKQARPEGFKRTPELDLSAAISVIANIKANWTAAEKAEIAVKEARALALTLGGSESKLLAQVECLVAENKALTAENATLKMERATIEASVDNRASAKALVIAGGQGVPALNVERGDGIKAKVTSKDEEHSQHFTAYAAITDPIERGKYYEEHIAPTFKKD
jgi:hypothetical protein